MQKLNTLFDDLLKISGAITILALFFSYIDIYSYYYHYKIDITKYISVSEIIISSFQTIVFLVIVFVSSMPFFAGAFVYFLDEFKNDKPKNKILAPLFWFIVNYGMIIFSFNFFGDIFMREKGNIWTLLESSLRFLLLQTLFLTLFFFIAREFAKHIYKIKRYNPKVIIWLIVLLPTMVIMITIHNQIGYENRKSGNSISKKTIYFQDGSFIKNNDSIYFIGNTEKFIFFWDKYLAKTIIYPASEVKKIEN